MKWLLIREGPQKDEDWFDGINVDQLMLVCWIASGRVERMVDKNEQKLNPVVNMLNFDNEIVPLKLW